MQNTSWQIKSVNLDKIPLDEIFRQRNIYHMDENTYFNPNALDLGSEGKILGINVAVKRIKKAIENKEKICIYADYDADGTCSCAILLKAFKQLSYKNVTHYIPSRQTEGYGLNTEAVKKISSQEVSLIITVDCGITSVEEISLANSLGIDVILTDHHHCPDVLPPAHCIINPHQKDCPSTFKNFCGAGLAYKLAVALLQENQIQPSTELLELAGIATVADIVELNGENRTIVKLALELIKNGENLGVDALLDVAGVDKNTVDSRTIGFMIGPRINSAGRIAHADIALKLLMADTKQEAKKNASELNQLNAKRQALVEQVYKDSLKQIDQKPSKSKVTITHSKDYHPGVIGIAASRLVDKYSKIAIVMAETPDVAVASLRSIEGFSIVDLLNYVKPLTMKSGGHEMAGGLSIKLEDLAKFKCKVYEFVDDFYTKHPYKPTTTIDLITTTDNLTMTTQEDMSKFEPFGSQNEGFTLALTDVQISYPTFMGKDKTHFTAKIKDTDLKLLRFNAYHDLKDMDMTKKMDIAFTLEKNTFNGWTNLQLKIEDMKYSIPAEGQSLKYIHDKLIDLDNLDKIIACTKKCDYTLLRLEDMTRLYGKTAVFAYHVKEYHYILKVLQLSYVQEVDVLLLPKMTELDDYDNIVFLKNVLEMKDCINKNIYQLFPQDFDIYKQGQEDLRKKMVVLYNIYKEKEEVSLKDVIQEYGLTTAEFYCINNILQSCKIVDISYDDSYNVAVAKLLQVDEKVDLQKQKIYNLYEDYFLKISK